METKVKSKGTFPSEEIELGTSRHFHDLVRPEPGAEEAAVDEVVEKEAPQLLGALDQPLQLVHGQVHEGVVGGSEDRPGSGCKRRIS